MNDKDINEIASLFGRRIWEHIVNTINASPNWKPDTDNPNLLLWMPDEDEIGSPTRRGTAHTGEPEAGQK